MELRRKRASSPPKSSRLQPSEPLHMTTRAASKVGSDASGSRRGSLISNGRTSPDGSYENEAERYPKRRKTSTASKTTPTRASQSSQSLSTASRPSTRSMSGGNLPPIAETPTMTRKRKRSSDVTAENISVGSIIQPLKTEASYESAAHNPPEAKKRPGRKPKRSSTSSAESRSLRSSNVYADKAQIDLNKANETHEHEAEVAEEASDEQVDESMEDGTNSVPNQPEIVVEEVLDDAPAEDGAKREENAISSNKKRISNASETGSDASQASVDAENPSLNDASLEQDDDVDEEPEEEDADGDGELPPEEEITTSLEVAPTTMIPTPAASAQASPAGSPPDSSVEHDSPIKRAATSVPVTEDGNVKGKKKLPGRRRAPHANPKVEAALRRQLHLRMNYRAVAKALKPILAELSHRSLRELENNPKAHEEASEYAGVKEGLHQHFEHRLAWLSKHKELSKKRLNDMLEAEMEMRRSQYENVARNMQEQHVIRLQHDFLNAVRQQEQEEDGHASDDEGGDVIPPLRHVTASGVLSDVLGPEYHWRSRPAVMTERLFDELYQRHEVLRDRKDHAEKPDFVESHPFTTFDPTFRNGAVADKNMETLLQALEEVQNIPAQPPPRPLPNNEAYGLQALANASATSAAIDAAMREAEERAQAQEEAAMREAEERARAQEEGAVQAKKEQEELQRPSPLSVPKPSLSQPPEENPLSASATAPTSAPTPVQTPKSEPTWPSEHPRRESQQPQQQQQQQQQQTLQRPPPIETAPRQANTFSQVTMGPSLTETAPLGRISSLMNQPSPHPIIPGLSIQPQPVRIPGLSYPIPGLSYQKPPTPQSQIRDPPPVRHVVSGTPVTTHTVPESSITMTTRPEEQHQADYSQSGRSQDITTAQGQASVGSESESRPAKDFWSSLARGAQENGTSAIRSGPKGASHHSTGEPETDQASGAQTMSRDNGSAHPLDTRPLDSHPLDNRPLDNRPLGRPPDNHPLGRSLDRLEELLQGPPPERPQERHQDRPSDRPLEASQDRASSKPPSTPSTIALEPLSQRLRSTSDSFGSFADRDNVEASRSKKKAPKTSLYGPWPRGRNYDPFKHDRRTSTTSVGSQDGSRQYQNYGTPDNRHPPYQPPAQHQQPPPFPASAPPHGSYPPPPPQYAPVPPPPYGHDPRATPYQQSPYQQPPYQQSPYGRPPTGFSSLPGPPPMTQPPPPSPYYGAPPPPFSQPQTPYAHHPPPLAARPPTSQAYGPQYGGQPILPANPGPGGYGQNGVSHGYPAAGHAGPAFAQYSQRDDGRRHDYGRGRGRHSGGHQEWKHYQGPR